MVTENVPMTSAFTKSSSAAEFHSTVRGSVPQPTPQLLVRDDFAPVQLRSRHGDGGCLLGTLELIFLGRGHEGPGNSIMVPQRHEPKLGVLLGQRVHEA